MANSIEQIRNIYELLKGYANYNYVDQKINPLTAPGDNFGSLMLAVDIFLKNEHNEEEKVVHAVAKLIPPSEFMRKVFCIEDSFKAEIRFYEDVIPTLQNFRRKFGLKEMSVFVRYYGSRLNLNGSDIVDENGVILLENLKTDGYRMMDRLISFDFDVAKIIIQKLASMHATSLALKLTLPNVFFKHVRPFNKSFRLPDEDFEKALEAWAIALKEDPETCTLAPRILAVIKKRGENRSIREPLATLALCDLWLNNIMVKKVNGGTHSIKFIDFQFPEYKSPVGDLLYFLFTSVKTEILDKELDFLLEYYYKSFTRCLSQFSCKIPSFTFENYLEEIRTEANQATVYQISFAILGIFALKENAKEGTEFDENPQIFGKITTLQKEKICFLAKEFTKRNWV